MAVLLPWHRRCIGLSYRTGAEALAHDEPGIRALQLAPRRTVLTLIAAGAIVFGGPALGYAQQGYAQQADAQQSSELARYGPPPGAPDAEGHTVTAPYRELALQQGDNADDGDNAVADNDNSSDDGEDASDNVNDNTTARRETDFLRAALSDITTEVQAGRLAQQQAGSDTVRRLGARMAGDNEAALADAASVAARYGVDAPPQPATSDEQQRIVDLANRSGADFDRAYLTSLVRDQWHDISEYTAVQGAMRDDVAEYASQHRSMLEDQLQAARTVAQDLGIDVD